MWSLPLVLCPWHPAGFGAEPLCSDAECRVETRARVLQADLIGQLDHSGAAEAPFEVGDLLVGNRGRGRGDGIGVGDGSALIVAVERGGFVFRDVLETVDV